MYITIYICVKINFGTVCSIEKEDIEMLSKYRYNPERNNPKLGLGNYTTLFKILLLLLSMCTV